MLSSIGFVEILRPFLVIKFSGEQLIIEKFLSLIIKDNILFIPIETKELFTLSKGVLFKLGPLPTIKTGLFENCFKTSQIIFIFKI